MPRGYLFLLTGMVSTLVLQLWISCETLIVRKITKGSRRRPSTSIWTWTWTWGMILVRASMRSLRIKLKKIVPWNLKCGCFLHHHSPFLHYPTKSLSTYYYLHLTRHSRASFQARFPTFSCMSCSSHTYFQVPVESTHLSNASRISLTLCDGPATLQDYPRMYVKM